MFTSTFVKTIRAQTKKLWCVLFLALTSIPIHAASPSARAELENNPSLAYSSESVLIRFKPEASAANKQQARQLVNGKTMRQFAIVNALEHLQLGPGRSVEKAIETLQRLPFVDFVEPDYVIRAYMVPDDYYYTEGLQWAPDNDGSFYLNLWGPFLGTLFPIKAGADIDANLAWDITTGSSDVIVAVIDTGVDYNHEDLAGNMWSNTGSSSGVHGYDFYNDDNNPMDEHGHGTHVAGTICAQGNNQVGVAGVAWQCQIMALRFLGADGSGYTSDAISAIEYAVENGAKISNNSWGGEPEFSDGLYTAIQSAAKSGHLFIAAAGNGGSDGVGDNNDSTADYPSSFDLNNIISVASTNAADDLSSFSNYGSNRVDLGAPGEDIVSTYTIAGDYEIASGTSMAAPHVAGVAVLVASMHPEWGYADIKNRILSTTRPLTSLAGKTVTGGVLNALDAVQEPATLPTAPTSLSATAVSDTEIMLTWEDNSNNEQGFRIERNSGSGWEVDFASVGANVTTYSDTGLTAENSYDYQVVAYNEVGDSAYTDVAPATTQSTPSDTVQTTVASSEIFGAGTVTGTYVDTAEANDGNVQTIVERLSGGKPANRYYYLQHTWVFTNVPIGTSTLYLKASASSASSNVELFDFSFSLDGSLYTSIPNTQDGESPVIYRAEFTLPESSDGTVYIRVTDNNSEASDTVADEISVDQLVIETQVDDSTPVDAFGLTAYPNTAKSGWHDVILSWTASTSVDVLRSEGTGEMGMIATGVSGGTYTDARISKGSATYTYKVCEAGTNNCSSEVVVIF
ncbi:peptidase S8/S53 subtilisin kexin sedolisin [Vibrio natriegens]|uniref:S8 family serine peptidase n=1 Tax=Vibrio natriegens TaxID=691 RepID=UPI00080413DE|nr:S8 family serine peptidase [Vibrio natriegens]ANQ21223.1 peptidase S8/S53 subtilisin kexin sedolisin [Vibrio natriegens]